MVAGSVDDDGDAAAAALDYASQTGWIHYQETVVSKAGV